MWATQWTKLISDILSNNLINFVWEKYSGSLMIQSKEVWRFELRFLNFSCLYFWHGTFDEGSGAMFIFGLCINCSLFPCRLLVPRLLAQLQGKPLPVYLILFRMYWSLYHWETGHMQTVLGCLYQQSIAREIYITCIYANIRVSESCDMGSCDRLLSALIF